MNDTTPAPMTVATRVTCAVGSPHCLTAAPYGYLLDGVGHACEPCARARLARQPGLVGSPLGDCLYVVLPGGDPIH
ncbi:hypothetical protein AB0M39_39710 [Streptomyces sp. NPDC051907]|uniref:hypothetical protein n=1 Tax=Streptomyces sp. NPDC051907 TaxID=3155284 RepID=UPI00341ADEE1